MLPEIMYKSLQEGRLPRVYPVKTLRERIPFQVKNLIQARDRIRNELALVKPLAIRKAVVITGANFSGYRTTLRNAYIGKYGDTLKFTVNYESQLTRPTMAKLVQRIGDVEKTMHVLFMPRAPYTLSVEKTLTDPASLRCSASVTSELGIFRYDSISQTYNVGLFDDRYKPVEEYPVSGADNARLDIAYSWRITNLVYPTPLPEGLTIDSMWARFQSGFLSYGGKYYKDPGTNNIIRVGARIRNITGAKITLKNWGFPLSVLYEDNRHVSQINVNVSFPDRTLYHGQLYSYYLDIPLPTWCYGKVALAHALNVYKGGHYIYGGGPLWQIECFRLRLP